MVLKPVCLFSQDEEIGEREGWRGRGNKVNTGNDSRGEKGRWTEGGRRGRKGSSDEWTRKGEEEMERI